jgi:hypothetical protein
VGRWLAAAAAVVIFVGGGRNVMLVRCRCHLHCTQC